MIIVADTIYNHLKKHLQRIDEVLTIHPKSALYDGIENHPDLHLLTIDGTRLISKEIYSTLVPFVEANPLSYHVLSQALGAKYPDTALLNAFVLGDCLVCNPKTIAPEVLTMAKAQGKKIISVKQGYTRCTTIPLIDSCITDDPGIYKTLAHHGIEALKVSQGHVALPQQSYGFIGGTAGLIDGCLYFNGDISEHPDYKAIQSHCQDRNIEVWYVKGQPLRDIGSLLVL